MLSALRSTMCEHLILTRQNRFAHQPEIYKNFLEILQTYQRESKPIQDVYSQVTQLFREAPDLLEDFKQFLPESAAQARAAAAAKAAAEDVVSGPGSIGPGGPSTRLPAVGTFPPPPSVPKEKGKKRAQAASQIDPKGDSARVPNKVRSFLPHLPKSTDMSQRHKITHPKPSMEQQIANLSPTLTPSQPEPLGSPPQIQASTDELAFFDRVKKFIGNKQTYNE
jgi:paired amphipathic helix protein Sin3a